MGRVTDNPGLDESRPAPEYGDTVGETAIHRLMRGRPMIDWKIIGPRTVRQNAHLVHADSDSREWLPEVTNKPLQLSLMPEVALAVLKFLDTISEPLPSRSGHSLTFRLKKNAAAILADHDGNSSPENR
jgi:hypothetical protein